MFDKLRSSIFWTLDRLKGQPVRKHFLEIRNAIETPDSDQTLIEQNELLHGLLHHAIISTGYYRELNINADISSFPVVNKSIIKSNFDSFISSNYQLKDLQSIVTSGSTGTPFKVYHDNRKRLRSSADTMYFASRAGFNIGDMLLYLKIWSASNKKSKMNAFLQNVIPFDVLKFNDPEIRRFLDSLTKGNHRKGILGYASALELIVKYMDRHQLKPMGNVYLKSAISMSEALSDYTKDGFKKYFDVDLFARYSNLENGIIAQQFGENNNQYLINTASYLVEILKLNSDEPASPGELGRIIVTDLFNYAMPMIRYDTGDIGRFHVDSTGNVNSNLLAHVEGRKLDLLYNTNGELISSYIMYKNMWRYTEISQYQLIQSGLKKYTFKINADESFDREEQLVSEFKEYLGYDADFQVEYVKEIPLLSSGKRKKIVNTFYTNS